MKIVNVVVCLLMLCSFNAYASTDSTTQCCPETDKVDAEIFTKVEDMLDITFVGYSKDRDFFRINLVAKNMSDKVIMRMSEITLILLDSSRSNVYSYTLLVIPELQPGETREMTSSIERIKGVSEVGLSVAYKVNFVRVDDPLD